MPAGRSTNITPTALIFYPAKIAWIVLKKQYKSSSHFSMNPARHSKANISPLPMLLVNQQLCRTLCPSWLALEDHECKKFQRAMQMNGTLGVTLRLRVGSLIPFGLLVIPLDAIQIPFTNQSKRCFSLPRTKRQLKRSASLLQPIAQSSAQMRILLNSSISSKNWDTTRSSFLILL